MHKVAAHKAKDDAFAEGLGQHWRGNTWADQLAKDARPQIIGHLVDWTRWQRRRPRSLAEALAGRAPQPWRCLRVLGRLPRDARQ